MNLDAALERMPQRGPMRLIERVVAADEARIDCIATDHVGADYPLRLAAGLMTVSLAELGAQAAAAHVSLFGVGGAHAGLLLSLASVRVPGPPRHEGTARLRVLAERQAHGPGGARYRMVVEDGGRCLIEGVALMRMEGREP